MVKKAKILLEGNNSKLLYISNPIADTEELQVLLSMTTSAIFCIKSLNAYYGLSIDTRAQLLSKSKNANPNLAITYQ